MATIEERAKAGCLEQYSPKCFSDGYIKGATEQREIDIEKAKRAHCKVCGVHCGKEGMDICNILCDFVKAMMEE